MNVLVLAHRSEQSEHGGVRTWLDEQVNSDQPFGLADLAVAGFIRIVTNPRIFDRPTPLPRALDAVDNLVGQPTHVPMAAGPRHWTIFRRLLKDADARGNVVPDAHLAAIALENGATIATRDRGFARFPGLRTVDPLAEA